MDVGIAVTTLRVLACNPDQREVLISPKRSYAIEQSLALRVLPGRADMVLWIGGNEKDNIHPPPEGMLQRRGNFGDRDSLVLDIDRPAGGAGRLEVLSSGRPVTGGAGVRGAL